MKMTTLPLGNLMNRSPLRLGFLLIPLVLGCFALSPTARAVVPAHHGGYPNGNTAEGDSALFNLTNGVGNTAIGLQALFSNTNGNENTANGVDALFENTTGAQNTATGVQALEFNTAGQNNTGTGVAALFHSEEGSFNTANGVKALFNTTGARAFAQVRFGFWIQAAAPSV